MSSARRKMLLLGAGVGISALVLPRIGSPMITNRGPPSNIQIGNKVVGSTALGVLYVDANGNLGLDPTNINYDPSTLTFTNKGPMNIGPGGAGDCTIVGRVNDGTIFNFGIDDSDSDKTKMSGPTGLGNDDWWDMDTSGNFTFHKNIGFFGTAAVAQPSAYTQTYSTADKTHANLTSATLTDSSGGSTDDTVSEVTDQSETTDNSVINDNFAEVTEEINALRVDLTDLKQLVNSIIDDLQALGLVG